MKFGYGVEYLGAKTYNGFCQSWDGLPPSGGSYARPYFWWPLAEEL